MEERFNPQSHGCIDPGSTNTHIVRQLGRQQQIIKRKRSPHDRNGPRGTVLRIASDNYEEKSEAEGVAAHRSSDLLRDVQRFRFLFHGSILRTSLLPRRKKIIAA
jgi:hypothetical protein